MTRDNIIRKPLTEEQKLDLVTNWFSEDWAIKNALGLLDDYDTVRADGIGEQAMNEKPKALRLAELLNEATTVLDEPFHHNAIADNCDKAAAELRRLHEAHDWQYLMARERLRRVEKLEAQRDALLEALHRISLASQNSMSSKDECGRIARAALQEQPR